MKVVIMSIIALIAFAANSVLCRLALHETDIDPASFTTVRLVSAAFMLSIIVLFSVKGTSTKTFFAQGSWSGSIALFVYAAAFSLAYIELTAATGALILFGMVQVAMLSISFAQGQRFTRWQWLGFSLAIVGLLLLFLPSASNPDVLSACLMAIAGVAWGVYSILGKGVSQPLLMTCGNFVRSIPLTLVLSVLWLTHFQVDALGLWYAVLSGALASGLGYAVWYGVLPSIPGTQAATLQLAVPVIATVGGIVLLDESLTTMFVLASISILGGIGLVLKASKP
ncbi:MAG: DMT family transporter [Glaciecola sp.]|jgi:drug/metabolite transporter (DMT)-like permease